MKIGREGQKDALSSGTLPPVSYCCFLRLPVVLFSLVLTEADLDTFCRRSVISHIKNEGNVLPTYFNPARPLLHFSVFSEGEIARSADVIS